MIVCAFIGTAFSLTYCSSTYGQAANTDENDLSLSINTDREIYAAGQEIKVSGKLTGIQGNFSGAKIIIQLSSMSNANKPQMMTHHGSTFSTNGSYTYQGIIAGDVGEYNVTAIENDSKTMAWTTFRIIGPLYSSLDAIWKVIIAEIVAFIFLFFLMLSSGRLIGDNKRFYIAALIRYTILSTMALIPLIAIIFFAGQMIPEGFMTITQISNNDDIMGSNGQIMSPWMMANIIGIPFYVIAFGLLGGFVGYSYKVIMKEDSDKDVSRIVEYEKKIKELIGNGQIALTEDQKKLILGWIESAKKKNERTDKDTFVHKTLEELTDIVVAPILAIGVWFLISQQITSIPSLAVISLSVGLVTRNILEGFRKYAITRAG